MEAIYNLKNGKRIAAFMWNEFLEDNFYRKSTTVREMDKNVFRVIGDEKEVEIKEDKNGGYFEWDGEKVYLKDFYADDVATMAARLQECVNKNDRWLVFDDEIWATFLKYSDDVVLLCDLPKYDMCIPPFGLATVGSDTATIACVLSESRYAKSQWSYKITVMPHDFIDKAVAPSENYYFSDFCSMLKSGRCTLIRKVDYMSYLLHQKVAENRVEKKSVIQFVKDLFKAS